MNEEEKKWHDKNESAMQAIQQGKFAEGKTLATEALELAEGLGPNTWRVAESMANLGIACNYLYEHEEAEKHLLEALAILDKLPDADQMEIANICSALSTVYGDLSKYSEQETYLNRAVKINMENPDKASLPLVNSAAMFYLNHPATGEGRKTAIKYGRELLEMAVVKCDERNGKDSEEVSHYLLNLAHAYELEGRDELAENISKNALKIAKRHGNKLHIANHCTNLGVFYSKRGRFDEAEPLIFEAMGVYQDMVDGGDPRIATGMNNIAMFYMRQKKFETAEPLFKRAIAALEQRWGAKSRHLRALLTNYASLLRDTGRIGEAEKIEEQLRSLEI